MTNEGWFKKRVSANIVGCCAVSRNINVCSIVSMDANGYCDCSAVTKDVSSSIAASKDTKGCMQCP